MKILVINSGSSSIKFKLFDMEKNENLVSGLIEEIGNKNSRAKMSVVATGEVLQTDEFIEDHHKGIEILNKFLKESGMVKNLSEVDGIGHRVVQGGDRFNKSVIIDDGIIKDIQELAPLAPLHNPGHLAGIKSVIEEAPNVKNVAVFDTVFHQTMPKHAYMYAIPYELYEKYDVRRYGFHGTSHKFVSEEAAKFMGIEKDKFNAITLHIGNGASAAAIKDGKCVDTSMGISPLEGLIMGTRSGDIDPAALEYISSKTGMSLKELDSMLNKKSGLLGICGTNDWREVVSMKFEKGDERASLAFDMYIYRIVKYIGSYYAALGRVDAIIFTAGVGENAVNLRREVCKAVSHLGVDIDENLNSIRSDVVRYIDKDGAKIRVLVVPTNEELAIALETKKLISK